MDWPQQALVSSAKIHVSYVKYEHNRSSEQLRAPQSKVTLQIKVTLELIRKIKRYRKCSRGILLNSYDKRYIVTLT